MQGFVNNRKEIAMSHKKIKTAIAVLLLIVMCLSVISYAYYTDHHAVVGEFTNGKVRVEVIESQFDSDTTQNKHTNITPRQNIKKDPYVRNSGRSDCYVFLEVEVPRSNRIFIDSNGQKLPEAYRDIYSYEVNPNWLLVDEFVTDKGNKPNVKRVYAYTTRRRLITLPPGEKTTVLFKNNDIFTANFIETGYMEKFHMPIKAYAIQTTDLINTDGSNTNDAQVVWELVKNRVYTNTNILGVWERTDQQMMLTFNADGTLEARMPSMEIVPGKYKYEPTDKEGVMLLNRGQQYYQTHFFVENDVLTIPNIGSFVHPYVYNSTPGNGAK